MWVWYAAMSITRNYTTINAIFFCCVLRKVTTVHICATNEAVIMVSTLQSSRRVLFAFWWFAQCGITQFCYLKLLKVSVPRLRLSNTGREFWWDHGLEISFNNSAFGSQRYRKWCSCRLLITYTGKVQAKQAHIVVTDKSANRHTILIKLKTDADIGKFVTVMTTYVFLVKRN